MRTLIAPRRQNGGFSLIELMVALVIGLVVSGAVLAFTVSSVRANSEYVQAVRLTQELRAVGQFVDSELRRAGYDEAALSYVANTSATEFSDFSPILVDVSDADANCVIYAYDRAPGNPGQVDLTNQEVRGIRRSTVTIDGEEVGVIEMAESNASAPACDGAAPDYTKFPVGCNTTSGWCAFSDPRTVGVDTFEINVGGDAASSHGTQDITATGYTPMQIREFKVSLVGHLRSNADVTQSLSLNVKVRANCLRELVTKCNAVPGA